MRKILLSILLCTFAVATWAKTSQIRLTFERTGTNAESVTVNVADQDETPLKGVTASLTTSHGFKGTAGNVTSSILCPNVNGNTNPIITMTFVVNGLGKFNVSSLDLYTHALNGQNEYQATNDNKVRQWNMEVNQDGNVSSLPDQDLAAGNNKKTFNLPFENPFSINNSTTITLTITRGTTNEGCFFGLSDIVLNVEEVETPEPEPDTETTYQLSAKPLSATDLMEKTTSTYIAIKNLSQLNDGWFVGEEDEDNRHSRHNFDESAVFVWEPVTAGQAGSYRLRQLDGDYMQQDSPANFGTIANAATFVAVNPGVGKSGNEEFNGDSGSTAFLLDGTTDPSLVRFVCGENWINVARLEQSTNVADYQTKYNRGTGGFTINYAYEVNLVAGFQVNISTAKYSTMYTSYPVELVDGIQAYYVSGVDGDKVTLENVEEVVPANTPVILYSETPCNCTLPFTQKPSATIEGNLLEGTLVDAMPYELYSNNGTKARNIEGYVLSMPTIEGVVQPVGLYKAAMNKRDGAAFLNNGGKAYLPASAIPANSAVQGFKFGDFTSTAIEGVVTDNEGAKVIYDLSGRRLNNITNAGVYIINGKKVMVK